MKSKKLLSTLLVTILLTTMFTQTIFAEEQSKGYESLSVKTDKLSEVLKTINEKDPMTSDELDKISKVAEIDIKSDNNTIQYQITSKDPINNINLTSELNNTNSEIITYDTNIIKNNYFSLISEPSKSNYLLNEIEEFAPIYHSVTYSYSYEHQDSTSVISTDIAIKVEMWYKKIIYSDGYNEGSKMIQVAATVLYCNESNPNDLILAPLCAGEQLDEYYNTVDVGMENDMVTVASSPTIGKTYYYLTNFSNYYHTNYWGVIKVDAVCDYFHGLSEYAGSATTTYGTWIDTGEPGGGH